MDFGLSIKGGLARGLGAIGVIRYMQEHNLQPTVIGGSSSGALVAGMYALGYSWDKMIDVVNDINVRQYLSFKSLFYTGNLISEQKFKKIILRYTPDVDFVDLNPKLLIFATNKNNLQRAVIEKGSVLEAIHASCAYPLVLSPSKHYSSYLDGDLSSSYSTERFRELGVSTVLGVSYKGEKFQLNSNPINKVFSLYRIFAGQVEQLNEAANPVDLEFKYGASDYGYFDFKHIDKLAQRTYESAARFRLQYKLEEIENKRTRKTQ